MGDGRDGSGSSGESEPKIESLDVDPETLSDGGVCLGGAASVGLNVEAVCMRTALDGAGVGATGVPAWARWADVVVVVVVVVVVGRGRLGVPFMP